MSKYGRVGWDVGIVGRWFRLVMGVLMTSFFVLDFVGGSHTHSLRTNVLTGLLFVGFVLVYFAAYLLVIERVKEKSPWIPTVLFVFPAMYFLINGTIVPTELSFGYLIGMPYVDHPIMLAMLLYVGVSMGVQFFTKYGGCEVIAIQNLIYRKQCVSYCVPLLPLDMAEKAIVDALERRWHVISEPSGAHD